MIVRHGLNLRAVGERRAGGIIVPFRVRDKYGTWWDEQSDFGLGLFKERPVFWWHLSKSQASKHGWKRAGTILDDSFELRPEGLYAESEIVDDFVWEQIRAGGHAYSTGTMPNLMEVRDDGYVARWAIVELSVAPEDAVVSVRGTTTAIVRAALPEIEGGDEELSRSIWIAGIGEKLVNDETTANEKGLRAELEALRAEVAALAPKKELPPSPPLREAQPRVEVRYQWDQASLWTIALRAALFPNLQQDQQYMRCMTAKVGDAIAEQEKLADNRLILPYGDTAALRALPVDDLALKRWMPAIRANEAMDTSGYTGLLDTLLNSLAWYVFRNETKVFSLFPSFMMTEPTVKRIVITGGPTVRLVGELTDQANAGVHNSTIPTSKVTTSTVTWATKKMGALTIASEEMFEESAVSMAEVWATQYARAFADAMDWTIINGDETDTIANISYYNTTGSATPSGTTDGTDKALALDGLRHFAMVDDTNTYNYQSGGDSVSTNGTIDSADIMRMRKKLGVRGNIGTDSSQLALIVDPEGYYKIAQLSDYKSMSDVENLSTLVNGFLGVWRGTPIIPSDQLPATATGGQVHQTAGNNTKSSMLLVHRMSNIVGMYRNLMMETSRIPHSEARAISATVRFDLQKMEADTTVYGYGVTP